MGIIVYDVKILLSSQKMARAMTPTQANLSSTFKLCLDFQQKEWTNPIPLSLFSHVRISAAHQEIPSTCHFYFGSPASPLLGLVASSGQKQAKASLLPGQTDHLCPDGNPTQWLWPPLLTVETRLSRLRSWGCIGCIECFNDPQHCITLQKHTSIQHTETRHKQQALGIRWEAGKDKACSRR